MATKRRSDRRIRYRHRRNKGCWGKAFYESWTIDIDPSLGGQTHLDIALHEGLHCLFPDLSEESVNSAGNVLADLLWRLGYRRTSEDDE